MHVIFARRQLEQGDNLSQRTFRVRHTTQLRSFGEGAGGGTDKLLLADARDVAVFSEGEAEAPILGRGIVGECVTRGACDMMNRTVDTILGVWPYQQCTRSLLFEALAKLHFWLMPIAS